MKNKHDKSMFNFVGNKYKQLSQLEEIFPQEINNFIDLFTGGGDVATNMLMRAHCVYANDINKFMIDMMKEFQSKSLNEVLDFVDKRINEFQLTRTNKEGYLKYRDLYNNGIYAEPLDLFTLTRFSFNNNIRFNNKCEFNQAFGANRSDFNATQRANTIKFHDNIQNVILSCGSFKDFDLSQFGSSDFIYADPPYLISSAYYNNGAKNAEQKWTQDDDLELFAYLDRASAQGIRFAMSNFIHHKGKTNEELVKWVEHNGYNTYNINSDYSHCVANIRENNEPTLEVVITNYEN